MPTPSAGNPTPRWPRLVHLLQLARPHMALPAAANLWVMLLLAWRLESKATRNPLLTDQALPAALLWTLLVAVGVHVYALALNDLLDVRHDRLFRPDRPLAAGRLRQRQAVAMSVLGLLGAVVASLPLGSWSSVLVVAAILLILFYNAMGKYLASAGLVALGAALILLMLTPNPHAAFLWPVWLNFTHILLCGTIAYHLEGKRPRLTAGHVWTLVAVWLFVSLAMVGWMHTRMPVPGARPSLLWLAPLLAACLFALGAMAALRRAGPSPRQQRSAALRFAAWAVAWMIVYDAAWLLGARLWWQAGLVAVLLPAALLIDRLMHGLNRSEPALKRYHLPQ